jgi:hypothetical protein
MAPSAVVVAAADLPSAYRWLFGAIPSILARAAHAAAASRCADEIKAVVVAPDHNW